MLSRTADSLFWMSRYVERAENTARMLDVGFRMSQLPRNVNDPSAEWRPPLAISGDMKAFAERFDAVTEDNVIRWLALDKENPSSVYESVRTARENAREIRGTLTNEMWESLNATWLEIKDLTMERLREWGYREFFEWVKERSNLFRGVTVGTMVQDQGFHFVRLGTFIERADNTARLLDVKYHLLVKDVGVAVDYYQWGALLRSVSAFKAYRRIYRDTIQPKLVAELLILREDFPRSLHACLSEVYNILQLLGPRHECSRLAGALHAELHFGRLEEIAKKGLHPFLTDFVARNNSLAVEIRKNFMMVT